ncbi:DUF4160 domain-containing protein [Methylorubrum podarium]|uniref:DUF4160 domain-containing protein n=1 Tax=Methylorubrum podarium TaxID=200476 RepID=A0ABV1QFW8_9HYPH
MPTVLRIGAFRIVIYPNDHRPAHVHAIGPDGEAVFLLNCPDGPTAIREVRGLSFRDAQAVARELDARVPALCASWETIHG